MQINSAQIARSIGWLGEDQEAPKFLDQYRKFFEELVQIRFLTTGDVVYRDSLIDVKATVLRLQNSSIRDIFSHALHDAVKADDYWKVVFNGLIVSFETPYELVSLSLRYSSEKIISYLLRYPLQKICGPYGKDITAAHHQLVLSEAMRKNSDTIIRQLLNSGFKFEGPTERSEFSLLADHLDPKNIELTKRYLHFGAKIETTTISCLIFAIKNGWKETAELLLQHGANPHFRTVEGETPILWAATRPEMVSLLLPYGVDVNSVDQFNRTPLYIACLLKSHHSAELLLKAGADVNLKQPIFSAIREDRVTLIKLFIQWGADVNAFQNGMTCLMMAASINIYFMSEIGQLLLEAGADPSLVDEQGKRALDYAQKMRHLELVSLLSKKKIE